MYLTKQESGPRGSTLYSVVLKLLIRGEFRLIPTIILLTAYGAAILAIPVVLNSVLLISASYLGLEGNEVLQKLLLSLYSEVGGSYLYVEALLFTGFAITCSLSGMAIGRRTRIAQSLFSLIGVGRGMIRSVMYFAIFLLCTSAVGLAFSVAIVLSSASLYVVSLLFGMPDSAISVDPSTLIYILALFALGYFSVLFGFARASNPR